MSTAGLTHMQRACLTIIAGMENEGLSPSYEELRAGLGLSSKSAVHRILSSLKERGCVDWLPRRPRSIRILAQDFSPAALERLTTEDLRRLAAHVAGILAFRQGGEKTFEQFDRIGRRVSGRPTQTGAH